MPTDIEWTDETLNVLVGCSRCSPGCDHCYAINTVHRELSPQHVGLTIRRPGGIGNAPGERLDWTGEVREVPHLLDQPLAWTRPRRVFMNSLSDVFHEDVSAEYIAEILARFSIAHRHQFQVLTKRSKRMRDLLSSDDFQALWRERRDARAAEDDVQRKAARGLVTADGAWPIPNLWLGVSVETAPYLFRARHLVETPAEVRFMSAEPLLGPLMPGLEAVLAAGLDWVIVGGESQAGARPMDPIWARNIRIACAKWNTAFMFKQAGTLLAREWGMPDNHGGTWDALPAEFQVREYPRERTPA